MVLAVSTFLMNIVIFIMARSQKLKEIAASKWPQRLTKEDAQDVI
ncbi:MAG TPA: hypothetical protein VGJ42_01455 [Nitrososphaera sp.]